MGETQPSVQRHNLGSGRGQIASAWAITVSYRSALAFVVIRFTLQMCGYGGLPIPPAIVAVVWLGGLAVGVSAIGDRPVAAAEMNGSFPSERPVSTESGKGRRVYSK